MKSENSLFSSTFLTQRISMDLLGTRTLMLPLMFLVQSLKITYVMGTIVFEWYKRMDST
ncbi:hypothetical protein CFP56_027789 [Quercus suber]|uniref:Uncharacterized protein n=1 Tax=Quercus suber TaxID=58331 RepID=A0AAW0LXS7_QUESU